MLFGRRFLRLVLVGVVWAVGLGACAPGLSPEQVQSLVNTAVVGTVGAHDQMGTAVALTVSAIAPRATVASSPTPTAVQTAASAAVIPTITPFTLPTTVARPKPSYACDISQRPFDETAYKPGDPFDIKWVITNTGTKTWGPGIAFKYSSGTQLTSVTHVGLPELKPNDKFSISLDANAPMEKGRYVMTWIVEGRICSTSVVIVSGRPGIDP